MKLNDTKVCIKCRQEKSASEFSPRRSQCKACRSAYSRKHARERRAKRKPRPSRIATAPVVIPVEEQRQRYPAVYHLETYDTATQRCLREVEIIGEQITAHNGAYWWCEFVDTENRPKRLIAKEYIYVRRTKDGRAVLVRSDNLILEPVALEVTP